MALLAQAARVVVRQAPGVQGVLKARPLRTAIPALAAERNLVYGQALLGCSRLSPQYFPKLARLLDSAAFRPASRRGCMPGWSGRCRFCPMPCWRRLSSAPANGTI